VPISSRLPLRYVVASTVLALIAAAGTYVLLAGGHHDDPASPNLDLTPAGDLPSAADAAFTTYDGDAVPLASLHGTPTLVNFFASTCAPCIKEMPALEEVHQELGDQVTFLGLAVEDRPEDAQALVDDTGVTYRTALDKDGSVINALEGVLLPTTVVLDADGTVVARHTGALTAAEVRDLLSSSLGTSP
jgi:thiol-disulfide isomerase/thioredoxin